MRDLLFRLNSTEMPLRRKLLKLQIHPPTTAHDHARLSSEDPTKNTGSPSITCKPLLWGGSSRLKELGNFQPPYIEVRGWCPRKQLNPGLDVHEPGDGVSKLCRFLRVCPPRRRVLLFFTASLLPAQSSVAFGCAEKKLHARSRPPPRSHTGLAITRSLQPDLEHSLVRKAPAFDQLKSIWKERTSGPQKQDAGGSCYGRDRERFQFF